jgi:quercetin dioxygenase-like cupin family protein
MALKHLAHGELGHAGPLGDALADTRTYTLVRTDDLQIFRLVQRAGADLAEHSVPGAMVFQCVEGEVIFRAPGCELRMRAGDFTHVGAGTPHSVHAVTDTSALVTVLGHNTAIKPHSSGAVVAGACRSEVKGEGAQRPEDTNEGRRPPPPPRGPEATTVPLKENNT